MIEQHKKEIERIFRESLTSDELFDAFIKSIQLNINDLELYKILLANAALSLDEIKFFTEKLSKEFKDIASEIYFWSASLLENLSHPDNLESAFAFYSKAITNNKYEYKPYLSIIKMYNAELDSPPQNSILQILKKGLDEVKIKSKLCYGIAEFYGKLNNQNMKNKYLALAASYLRKKL